MTGEAPHQVIEPHRLLTRVPPARRQPSLLLVLLLVFALAFGLGVASFWLWLLVTTPPAAAIPTVV